MRRNFSDEKINKNLSLKALDVLKLPAQKKSVKDKPELLQQAPIDTIQAICDYNPYTEMINIQMSASM